MFLKALIVHRDIPSWNLMLGEEAGGEGRFAETIAVEKGEEYAIAFATFADGEDPLAWFARVKDDPVFAIREQAALLDLEIDPDILRATFGTSE